MRDHSPQTSGQRSSLSTPLPRTPILHCYGFIIHPSPWIGRKCGNKRQVNKLFPSVSALQVLFPKTKQHIAAQPILWLIEIKSNKQLKDLSMVIQIFSIQYSKWSNIVVSRAPQNHNIVLNHYWKGEWTYTTYLLGLVICLLKVDWSKLQTSYNLL